MLAHELLGTLNIEEDIRIKVVSKEIK